MPEQRVVTLASGSVMGRDHIAFSKNNQDSHTFWVSPDYPAGFGIVSDGCGSGKKSEVGSSLTASFLRRRFQEAFHFSRDSVALDYILRICLDGLKWTFKTMLDECLHSEPFADPGEFVSTHLLATIVGFCYYKDEGLVFQYGDGIFAIGDEVIETDQNNTPNYFAYELRGATRAVTLRKFNLNEVNRVAVATDGFKPSLFPEVFEHKGNGLQRWMNIRRNSGDFRDDSTIVTAKW